MLQTRLKIIKAVSTRYKANILLHVNCQKIMAASMRALQVYVTFSDTVQPRFPARAN